MVMYSKPIIDPTAQLQMPILLTFLFVNNQPCYKQKDMSNWHWKRKQTNNSTKHTKQRQDQKKENDELPKKTTKNDSSSFALFDISA
jgi:hypothetical protein